MKTAYELAMQRLSQTSPTVALSAEQKRQIAELESRYKAKIAEREIHLEGQIGQATAAGDFETATKLEQELARERQKLQAELEAKKQAVRESKA